MQENSCEKRMLLLGTIITDMVVLKRLLKKTTIVSQAGSLLEKQPAVAALVEKILMFDGPVKSPEKSVSCHYKRSRRPRIF
jgi:hypothetical protein